ncbi:UPF0182 family membrane protein [Actinacidiphila guanduensis]|uniref:UPF0182 protein SAMN05216259_103333 n=1 Tax=Actinacidiphila guanduensis TaxID=310781 RepID=A0A1G9ZWQ1_9ACTN|nr:UPF0182 family protein [Actinacidiphila guanduensis]SDN25859.1 hypothetical protein SAMN05216259_103333 [Actinacidiphila guanduensis]
MPDRGRAPSGTRPAPARAARGTRALLVAVAVIAVLMVAFVMSAGLWTDLLWYRSVHYSSVFTTVLWTRAGLFAVFGLAMAGAVGLNMYLAHRLRPPLSAMSAEQHNLDRYRMALAPYRGWTVLAVSALAGLVAGVASASQWRLWLQYAHATSFHTKDPQFHKDVSFYAFDLPWYRFLLGFGFAAVVVCLVAAALVHYLYGGLRLTSPGGGRATRAATGHLAVLIGLFVSLKAVAYWLDRYRLAVKSGGMKSAGGWTGLRYVDANAYLPAKTTLFFIAVICALLFFATVWRGTWTLPGTAFGLMILSAILIGGLYPAIVQKFQVQPNEAAKEAPYIQRNIDATRAAYGIDRTVQTPYKGTSTASNAKLRADTSGAAEIRLLDPDVVAPTFQQTQQGGSYYSFPSTLDVDRYTVDGREQDTVIGVREIDSDDIPDGSWINDHFRYTHGYGVVAAKGTEVTGGHGGAAAGAGAQDQSGRPVYTEGGLPATGDLGGYPQQIYYGEQTRQYAIVDGPTKELDYADGSGVRTTRYSGPGVSLANPITRAAYALSFGEPKILYSGAIGDDSKILYNRTPTQRVESVAPWLTVDGDPYPAVVGGRVVWIVDAYTTTDGYPYASRTTLGAGTADSATGGQGPGATRQNQVNYVRNSVKATVDAYSGAVRLYQWDTQDPVLKTWMKAFPHTVLPKSAIPAGLLSHLRYPQDLFTVQRQMLATYHVTGAAEFSGGSGDWQVPADPATKSGKPVPPYYLSLKMPGRSSQDFSLTSTFTPVKRGSLAAVLAVDSDATSPDYGTLRLLELPADAPVDGPALVQGTFDSEPAYAKAISQLRGKGSTVEYGNLLTVPLDGGLLYVEPVYVRGAGTDYPVLRKVFVSFGRNKALEDTLGQALDAVFGRSPAAAAPAGAHSPPGGTSRDPALQAELTRAQQAYDDARAAMQKGDWGAYGAAQKRLGQALAQARKNATN